MTLKYQLACLVAILALSTTGAGRLNAEESSASPERLATRVDDIARKALESQHIPGLSLAVIRDGRLVLAKGYGMANLELQVPATPETVYQIQSITKSFTATGIMMLVEEGKVGLDRKISTYLAGTPETWKDIRSGTC